MLKVEDGRLEAARPLDTLDKWKARASMATARHVSTRRLAILASMLIALIVSGCGGSSSSGSSPKPATTSSESASSGIPQNNEGDHDPDNNGAPSDGDGNQ